MDITTISDGLILFLFKYLSLYCLFQCVALLRNLLVVRWEAVNLGFEGVEGCDDGFAAGMGLTKGNYETSRRTALRRY